MPKTAVAIRHVAFEDLGTFRPVLEQQGYAVHLYDAGIDELLTLDPLKSDLLVVLGGPIGACEEDRYPFVSDELRLLEQRLAANRPTLGVCLGAQLIARALGGRVYAGHGKEIGWSPLTIADAGKECFAAQLADVPVLHWHGDTFELPEGAVRLASTERYANQAFSMGPNIAGLQFHAEVDAAGIERWLIGHACEIAAAGLDPNRLRAESRRHGPRLQQAGAALLRQWLGALERY